MLIENIINKHYIEAKRQIFEQLNFILERNLNSYKKIVGENLIEEDTEEPQELDEGNVQKQGRIKLIKVRIRGGKVQRRVKKSAVKGFTLKGGKLKRITFSQKLKMKRVQKRAAIKRRAKMARAIMKRKKSMRRLKALGVR